MLFGINTSRMLLVGGRSQLLGDKHSSANRPDGDHNATAAGEVCSSEIPKTLRERSALRGNVPQLVYY